MNDPAGQNDQECGLSLPPLSLYVHLPWCVKKCPYCDFNSHALLGEIPAEEYVNVLIADLENELPQIWGRPVHSVFFGGGTPSLFAAEHIDRFLSAARSRIQLAPSAEVTLEANPGAIEYDRFSAYRDAGINRVSLGVQSFDDQALKRIGRVHGSGEVLKAVGAIKDAGLHNFNLDIMYGLPEQTSDQALKDIELALQQNPAHISHYQLTLEPNTAFHARGIALPDEETCWQMQTRCATILKSNGFEQYEISAWAKPGRQCAHNLNYWRYGDYLGVGAGAHSKITLGSDNVIRRSGKVRHPKAYLKAPEQGQWHAFTEDVQSLERCFEFFLNQLRLHDGVNLDDFGPRTGLALTVAEKAVTIAKKKGLLVQKDSMLVPTELGWRFVNDTQGLFLTENL